MSQTTQPSTGGLLAALIGRPWALPADTLALVADIIRTQPIGQAITELQAAFDQYGKERFTRSGSVAVVPILGAITQRSSLMSYFFGGTSIDSLRAALNEAIGDPQTTAVVLDFNSPGGDVAGITELAEEIRALRGAGKPIVGVANTMAASAAYWLISQCDEVIVTPSGVVGSIGVYAIHQDFSRAYEEAGITNTIIKAGPKKIAANEFEPLTDDAKSSMQERVDAYYSMFLADVAKGRRVPTSQVASAYGQGDIVLARDALAAGMVDRIATLDATVRRLVGAKAARVPQRAEGEPVEIAAESGGDANESADDTNDSTRPFAERLTALADEGADLLSHAQERARLRAKEGRPAFSTTTETSLRTIRGQIDELLATGDPEPAVNPAPTDEPAESAAPTTPPVATAADAPPRFHSQEEWIAYLTKKEPPSNATR
jgi:signal peptide peptidase SppA